MPAPLPALSLLPILMGLSTYAITKFSSTAPSGDANQKMIMIMMPIMLPVMCYSFPSGLFIYWLTSNVWQSGHQIWAKKIVHKKEAETAAAEPQLATVVKAAPFKKSSRTKKKR